MSRGSLIKYGKIEHVQNPQEFSAENYKNIIGNNSVKSKLAIDQFTLSVKIHQKMYSNSQLMVYYIRADGEIVGNKIEFKVENCLQNKVLLPIIQIHVQNNYLSIFF